MSEPGQANPDKSDSLSRQAFAEPLEASVRPELIVGAEAGAESDLLNVQLASPSAAEPLTPSELNSNLLIPGAGVRSSVGPKSGTGPISVPVSVPIQGPCLMIPIAPKLPGLPHVFILWMAIGLIVCFASSVEEYRARIMLDISDRVEGSFFNGTGMHMNYANVLARNGKNREAAQSLEKIISDYEKVTPKRGPRSGHRSEVMLLSEANYGFLAQLLARQALAQYEADEYTLQSAVPTIDKLFAVLDEKSLPAVPIETVWQLDGLARAIGYKDNATPEERRLAIRIWKKAAWYWHGGNTVIPVNYYSGIGRQESVLGNYASAGDNFMKVIALSEIRKDKDWRLEHLNLAAYNYSRAHDYVKAATAARLAISMAERLGNKFDREKRYAEDLLSTAESAMNRKLSK